jgi:MFS family permease
LRFSCASLNGAFKNHGANVKLQPAGSVLVSRNFLLTFLSFFFLWISFDFVILYPLFILQLGGNSVDVGTQMAIFIIASVLLRPLAGWLSDRIGRLKVLWFGAFLMVLSSFAFLFVKGSYQEAKWFMAFIFILRGSAFASFYTAFFTYVADMTVPENRMRVLGLFGLSGLIGHGLAPKIGEMVMHRFGFDGVFILGGVLALIGVAISAMLKESKDRARHPDGGWTIFRNVTFSRRNVIFLPGAFVFGYVVSCFDTFVGPFYLHAKIGSVGWFFLVYGLAAALLRVTLGTHADHYTRWKLVSLFSGILAIGVGVIFIEPIQYFSLVSAAICGGAHGILFPSLTAIAIDAHPAEVRGMVTSVFTAAIELGFAFGSYVQGVMIAVAGYPVMFLSGTAVALLFAVAVWRHHAK